MTSAAHVGLGKVILLGEHAVVYGHPAFAGALSLRVELRAEVATGSASRLTVEGWQLDVTTDDDHVVSRALAAIIEAAGCDPLTLSGTSDLPPRAGLGSSAALSVAIARAALAAAGGAVTNRDVEVIANAGETCFHSNPSGVDVALATRGGLGVFRKGHGLRGLPCEPIPLVVGLSGQPRSTAAMVDSVAAFVEREPITGEAILDRLGRAARDGVEAVDRNDYTRLGTLFTRAQDGLRELGLSTDVLDAMVDAANRAGALGTKLTGAGGGGSVIALAPGVEADVIAAWRSLGYDGFAAQAGVRP